jgi:hypothetical protein
MSARAPAPARWAPTRRKCRLGPAVFRGPLVVVAAFAAFAAFAAGAAPSRAANAPPKPAARPPAAAGQGQPETFEEKVLVREIEVIVELPDTLRGSRRKALGPQDFQVLEDGRFRQVEKASPVAAGEAGAWRLVLYFDRVLADPETVFFTANTLAQQAAKLTGLGSVDLVIADPQPRVALADSRDPKALQQALIDLAAQAQRQRGAALPGRQPAGARGTAGSPTAAAGQPAQGPGAAKPSGQPVAAPPGRGPAAAAPPEPQVVRRQEDRLISLVAARPSGGPRALVLVADGFDTSRSGGAADSATAAVAEEPARTLAAYGWITIAAPMRRQELGIEHREMTDVERIRQSNAGREAPGSSVPPEILPQAAPDSRLKYEGVLSLFVEPSSATLTAMASATAGTVVGYPGQLSAALAGLAKRWDLFYLAPDPADGRPRPVEVRLSPEGTLLRTPVWRRSSTPDEVAAARLRQLLAGGGDRGTLAIEAVPVGADRGSLRLTVGAFSTRDSIPPGPFRLSLAFTGPGIASTAVRHRLLDSANLTERGWTETLKLDAPPGARRVAVEVEDLTHQLWGAAAADLAPGPAPAGR